MCFNKEDDPRSTVEVFFWLLDEVTPRIPSTVNRLWFQESSVNQKSVLLASGLSILINIIEVNMKKRYNLC